MVKLRSMMVAGKAGLEGKGHVSSVSVTYSMKQHTERGAFVEWGEVVC